MKKIFALVAVAGLGLAAIGCEKKPPAPTAKPDTGAPADTGAKPSGDAPAETPKEGESK